ncbi:MAG: WecB/TagA/CpsF family glycosyltransferase [Anaerolineales bacterium]
MNFAQISGIQIADCDKQALLNQVFDWAKQPQPRTILYVNAHCLNLAARLPDYRTRLQQADLVYADGISVVWASRFLGQPRLHKITGRDWINDFSAQAAQKAIKMFILAGQPGIAERAAHHLQSHWHNLNIVGTADGYFSTRTESETLQHIAATAPDVLFVGRGSPLQEHWIAANRPRLNVPVVWAVGALFDYVAGIEKPVPMWMNRLALEWLWRLLINPRDKWRRYLLGNPEFVVRVFIERLRHG